MQGALIVRDKASTRDLNPEKINMASAQDQLISRIVRSGDLATVLDFGINISDFIHDHCRSMFNHIMGYYTVAETQGSVIGPNTMRDQYQFFVECDDPHVTTEALCHAARLERLNSELTLEQVKINELQQSGDVIGALNAMQRAVTDLQNIGIGTNTDSFCSNAIERWYLEYEKRANGIFDTVASWPWEPLNRVTPGVASSEYVVIYGRPKSFKSWVLADTIAYMFEQGKRCVIYTKEMTEENIYDRVFCCIAKVSYHNFRMGTCTPQEKEALYSTVSYVRALRASNQMVVLSGQDAPSGGDTVPWFRAKLEKYKPHFSFIDGLYLMSDHKGAKADHDRVRNISRDLRQVTLDLKIPLLATLQANRKAAGHNEANLDEIAFSDGISQDATLIMRVIKEKDSDTCQLILGGAREFKLNGFRIHAIPAINFSYKEEISAKDIEKAKEADVADGDDNVDAHIQKKTKAGGTAGIRKPATANQALERATANIENDIRNAV